jgi:RNA polymerase sporulation-specific sigma factor
LFAAAEQEPPVAVRFDTLPLQELPDDQLVERFHAGDPEAFVVLLERYRRFAGAKARCYFLVGADSDDIEQEGMIGLYKAARDFRADRRSSFPAFAELCITRQVLTAIKMATRRKHQPLNQYVSISAGAGSEDPVDGGAEELLHDRSEVDPADAVVSHESMDAMRRSLEGMLSGLEVDVLRLYVEGRSYEEIGACLGRHVKAVDNALQRTKQKLDLHLRAEAVEAAMV